jgi:hypothetical protein
VLGRSRPTCCLPRGTDCPVYFQGVVMLPGCDRSRGISLHNKLRTRSRAPQGWFVTSTLLRHKSGCMHARTRDSVWGSYGVLQLTEKRITPEYRSLWMPLVPKWLRPKRDLKGRTWGHNVVTTRSKRRTSTVDRAPNRRHRPESTRRVECIALATRGGRNHFLNDPSSHLAGVLQQSIPAARPIRRGGCRRGRGRGGRGRGGRGRGRCRSG